MKTASAIAASLLLSQVLPSHAQLPSHSRTVYKCEVDGRVAYTDKPCLGAKRLDIVPTRGVDKLSGTTRAGADVTRERRQEEFARAIKPLTGMNEQQFATAARRHHLGAGTQRDCRTLEAAILDKEQIEQNGGARGVIATVQQETLSLRQRYHELGC